MSLQGGWKRISTAREFEIYPEEIEFRETTYTGRAAPGSAMIPVWDAGEYKVLSGSEVRISTANDALVTYGYALAGDVLSVRDPQGRTVQYRRLS